MHILVICKSVGNEETMRAESFPTREEAIARAFTLYNPDNPSSFGMEDMLILEDGADFIRPQSDPQGNPVLRY